MDQETLKCAYDPFFSKKSAGRQVGLGLSKALRLIEGLHGTIDLVSEPDKGTMAVLALPLTATSEMYERETGLETHHDTTVTAE